MRLTKALYMFSFIPPELTSLRIDSVRHGSSEEFTFGSASKPPVHITLLDPFFIPLELAPLFESRMDIIEDWADGQSSFAVEHVGFDPFANLSSPIVYPAVNIDAVKNRQLHDLRNGFLRQITKHFGFEITRRRNKPRLTIGYRDISSHAFQWLKADSSGSGFNDNFNCEAFYLCKHDGSNWQVVREFALNGLCEQLPLFAV